MAQVIVGIIATVALPQIMKHNSTSQHAGFADDDPLGYDSVRTGLGDAFMDSNPCTVFPTGQADPGLTKNCGQHEETGWIVEFSGLWLTFFSRFEVRRAPGGGSRAAELDANREPWFGSVVATWHTHPIQWVNERGTVFNPGPSGGDVHAAKVYDGHGMQMYVIDWESVHKLSDTGQHTVVGATEDLLGIKNEMRF